MGLNRALVRLCFYVVVLCIATVPDIAMAHSPIPGIGVFYSGALHPLRVAEQLLGLLALALLFGQTGMRESIHSLVAFFVGLMVGLPLLIYGPAETGRVSETLLLVAAGGIGIWVATARKMMPSARFFLAMLVAGAVVADSVQEGIPQEKFLLATLGVLAGASVLVLNLGVIVEELKPQWARIGVRVAGSWIAAASLMVLALKLRAIQG